MLQTNGKGNKISSSLHPIARKLAGSVGVNECGQYPQNPADVKIDHKKSHEKEVRIFAYFGSRQKSVRGVKQLFFSKKNVLERFGQ